MKQRNVYKIVGYIIKSFIDPRFFRSNFEDYKVIDDKKVDLVVNMKINTNKRLPSFAKDVDEYKYYYFENESHCYFYKKNKYVISCNLYISVQEASSIDIFVSEENYDLAIIKKEITYSFMDSFYSFLTEKGIFCLHSCGFSINDKGILISGAPGSGKSTLANELSKCFLVRYVGEDVNACKVEMTFWGMPWCRVNNNTFSSIDVIIFLGDRNMELKEDDIYKLLMKSEFSMNWLPSSCLTARKLSTVINQKVKCFMLKNTKDEIIINRLKKIVEEIVYV